MLDEELQKRVIEHLGNCIEYIDVLENSINRMNAEAVFDDMVETPLDFKQALKDYNEAKGL